MVFRKVGKKGEPYPAWLLAHKHQSGVYVIKEGATVVYVGESHAGRLYGTVTRHFQEWTRNKQHWKGSYSQHDPGLTYVREKCSVGVKVTRANDAIREQDKQIARLKPRDNIQGKPDEDEDSGWGSY